LTKQ